LVLAQVPDQANVPDRVQALVVANVLLQIQRLCDYQIVRERSGAGNLTLYSLVYDIEDGSLREVARRTEHVPPGSVTSC
jgi:carbonic anhydrase